MLIIDGNSVYEIDENCVKKKKLPAECQVYEKLVAERKKREEKKAEEKSG